MSLIESPTRSCSNTLTGSADVSPVASRCGWNTSRLQRELSGLQLLPGVGRSSAGFYSSVDLPDSFYNTMPLFSYPIPSDWLLPIIEIPLWLASLIFQFFQMIGLVGTSVVLLIVMALFVRNIMGPLRA